MADTTPIVCESFSDIYKICESRCAQRGSVQDKIRNFFKASINEHYQKIATERRWTWRSKDRSFVYNTSITTGTVSVTVDSRIIVFSGLTVTNDFIDRSIRVGTDSEIYRIVGVDTATSTAYLECPYVGTTNATAQHRLYSYEFGLPPDCDQTCDIFLYIDSPTYGDGQINYLTTPEFNRLISYSSGIARLPCFYTVDGNIINNQKNIAVLDEMILDIDPLADDISSTAKISRLRLFPIDPDKKRIIHLNYPLLVEPLKSDDDKPLMPRDTRWALVHFALSDWYNTIGSKESSDREFLLGADILKEMRLKQKATDIKPKMIVNANMYARRHTLGKNRLDEFYAARELEGTD